MADQQDPAVLGDVAHDIGRALGEQVGGVALRYQRAAGAEREARAGQRDGGFFIGLPRLRRVVHRRAQLGQEARAMRRRHALAGLVARRA